LELENKTASALKIPRSKGIVQIYSDSRLQPFAMSAKSFYNVENDEKIDLSYCCML